VSRSRDTVIGVLGGAQEDVVDRAAAALARRGDPHYSREDPRPKLETLYRRVTQSIEEGDSAVVADYCDALAAERLQGGFDIAELQAAFNALEEAAWAGLAPRDSPEGLRAVEAFSRALGVGRDALVTAYVRLTTRITPAVTGTAEDPTARVATESRGEVGVLTMNDPAKRNALSTRMTQDIMSGLDRLISKNVRAIVLRSAPSMSVWSSGHDINELPRGRRDPLAYDDPLERCLRAVRSVPVPVIAMVRGSVWGGAFDLVLSCDIVVADETATFAITPANLGLPYNTTGLLHFLGRLPINVVKEMFFTGTPIDATQAERWLVVNHLVASADLEPATFTLADVMAAKAPLAIAAVKEQLRVLTDYQPVAAQVYERIQGLRRQAYDSQDYLEGLAAFRERRPPNFRGN